MAITVEDICNAALRRIKYPTPIGSMYDGSAAARVALDTYSTTRDALFTETDWPFTRQMVTLSLLKTAPPGGYPNGVWTSAYPPLPWIYEYGYPPGCLKIRSLRPTPSIVPEFAPTTNLFETAYDSALQQKVILTNLVNAQANITAQITDPTEWQDPNFTEALIERLAALFARSDLISENPNDRQMNERDASMAAAVADARRQ